MLRSSIRQILVASSLRLAQNVVFMPHAEMRGRPQVGEKVWVRLYTDKSGRFAVSMDVDDEMRRASKAATEATVGQLCKRCYL